MNAQELHQLPVSIHVSDTQDCPLQWSNSTKFILVLSGTMILQEDEQTYTLSDGDVVVINPRTLYSYSCSDCVHILCQIDISRLPFIDIADQDIFLINSVEFPSKHKYNELRKLLCELVTIQEESHPELPTLSTVYALINECSRNFTAKNKSSDHSTEKKYSKHTRSVLNYILDHYKENLTLQSVAETMFLSVPYLSALFKKEVGVTFTAFYNDIRLNCAVDDLLTTDFLIDEIAFNNGFQDSRTFLRLFKKKYNMLPSVFRKKHKVIQTSDTIVSSGLFFPAVTKSTYNRLIKRLIEEQTANAGNDSPVKDIKCGSIDFARPGTPLRHTFRKVCSISSAKALLFDEVRDILRTMQETIHFEYISFNGLLNIDPYLYSENADGTPVFTFVLIDKVIDFLLSIDLKPMINFSYMPLLLCRDVPPNDGNYLFRSTPPKDYDRWFQLITELTKHLVSRYGEAMVATWPFNVWRKPDVKLFSIGTQEFFKLYKTTYDAIKSISKKFRFGSPALGYNTTAIRKWDSEFFDYCQENKCVPDFLCFTYYNDIFDDDSSQALYVKPKSRLNTDPDAYSKYLDSVEKFVAEKGLSDKPLHMLQWNLTVSHRNLINDTCFSASFTAKNLLENYDRTDSFCFWCSTDFSEELALPNDLFFGGPGMFTHNGLRKPAFFLFQFLSKLGDELIGRGRGWFATRNRVNNRIIIMFYNYIQYSDAFANGNYYDLTQTNRYSSFSEQTNAKFTLKIEGLKTDHCFIREFFINREQGSCFDKWNEMGGLPLLEDELSVLKMTEPGLLLHKEKVNNGVLYIESTLLPHEVRRVEVIL